MSRYATVIDTGNSRIDFVQSADPVDLARRVNALLIEMATLAGARIAAINLSGAGDGHSFVAEILSVAAANDLEDVAVNVNPNAPSAVPNSEIVAICYMASDAGVTGLVHQRSRAVAAALAAAPTFSFAKIIDEQNAGASKGLRYMGLILGVFSPGP